MHTTEEDRPNGQNDDTRGPSLHRTSSLSFGANASIPHPAAATDPTNYDREHRNASNAVKSSLADLKVRLAQMRDNKADTQRESIDSDLKAYEQRRADFEARHGE